MKAMKEITLKLRSKRKENQKYLKAYSKYKKRREKTKYKKTKNNSKK